MPDSPTSIAEVAVTLAGFSGLFVVLQRRSSGFEEVERFALYYLLLTSLGAALLALLPLFLSRLTGASVLWLCIASGAYLTILSTWRAWTIAKMPHSRFPWARRILGFLQWLVVGALVLAIVNAFDREATYLLSLWWLVFAAATQFFLQVVYSLRVNAYGQNSGDA